MPSTMGHHSRIRAAQDSTKLLVCGGYPWTDIDQYLTGFDLVNVGEMDFGDIEDPVRYPWTDRLVAQLNTGWEPRCILLQHEAPNSLFSLITHQEYEAAWLGLVAAAQTSSALVVVLVGTTQVAFLNSLPADQILALLPPDIAGPDTTWNEPTRLAQAKIIADLVYSS